MSRASDRLRAALQRCWIIDERGGREPQVWLERVQAAIAGGVTCLQLGDHRSAGQALAERMRALRRVCEPHGVPIVIQDHIDLARELAADGVLLTRGDADVRLIRERLPPHGFIGGSIGSLAQLDRAHRWPVDYWMVHLLTEPGMGMTGSASAVGLAELAALRAATDLPLVASGAFPGDRWSAVLAAGADGMALAQAFEEVEHPAALAGQMMAAFAAAGRLAQPARVLTIAGSDSGGGAGIQADLKTFAALGCFGMSAITAVTAQNTVGVQAIHALPPEFLARQIESVLEDLGADAIKIGMLRDRALVDVVAAALDRHPEIPVVLDPVMVATSGDALIREDTVEAIITDLLPRAAVVTPNLDELALMVGKPLADPDAALAAARELLARGARSVLVKGGHLPGDTVVDLLVDAYGERLRLTAERIATANTHGTGCSLSSAIAAHLALGAPLEDAVRAAAAYVRQGLRSAQALRFGAGHGPLDHQHQPRRLARFMVRAPETRR